MAQKRKERATPTGAIRGISDVVLPLFSSFRLFGVITGTFPGSVNLHRLYLAGRNQ